jgi:hypothetical protein
MGILGGMSESERQHVQGKVQAAMDVQVLDEGRHQGGRAPYGYMGGRRWSAPESAQGRRGLPTAALRARRTRCRVKSQ